MKLPVEWILERVPLKADAEEIAERLTMAGFEVEGKGESALGPVLDIKVTPNRGDGLSVMGVSRELSAAYRTQMNSVKGTATSVILQFASVALDTPYLVTVNSPDLCPRYSARIVRNVKVGPSPQWIQDRVEAAGMRPINNVVDVTNYVMLETGQPLHAFDFDSLHGGKVIVRRANPGEVLTTLDGVERTLTPEMLVIADADRAIALAGLMGGAETEMGDSTTTVLLESAHFHPLSVRRTARALDMATEASYRFQRYVDPNTVLEASNRACQLLAEIGAGDVDDAAVDVYPSPVERRQLAVRPQRVSAMLGFEVSREQVIETLNWLGFELAEEPPFIPVLGPEGELGVASSLVPHPSSLVFLVPTWRPDIVREIDLVEEVGRVLGYEHIPEKLPSGHSTQGGDSDWGRFAERIREALTGSGLQEIVSHSLIAPTPLEDGRSTANRVPIRSALSAELSGLRQSLLPGLVDALERNARRGNVPLAFFEVGHIFNKAGDGCAETTMVGGIAAGPIASGSWDKVSRSAPIDYYGVRGLVERIADTLHITDLRFEKGDDPRLHPGRCATVYAGNTRLGYVGEMHPDLTSGLRIKDRVVVFGLDAGPLMAAANSSGRFQGLSPYPGVTRDLAPRLAGETTFAQVYAAIRSTNVNILEEVRLTDVFSGAPLPEGTKSFTLTFTFRAADRTLNEAEVNEAVTQLRSALETGCGAIFAA